MQMLTYNLTLLDRAVEHSSAHGQLTTKPLFSGIPPSTGKHTWKIVPQVRIYVCIKCSPAPEVNSAGWDSQLVMSPRSCRIWGAGIVRTTISNCSEEPVSLETSHLLSLKLIWVTRCLKQISAPVPKAKSCSHNQDFPHEWGGREVTNWIHSDK